MDVARSTGLLREAEERHGAHGRTAQPHHWSDSCATLMVARGQGRTIAAAPAQKHKESVLR